MKKAALYLRVSSKPQDTKSQVPDMRKWADTADEETVWFEDKFTGKTMDRPGWKALEAELRAGRLSKIVVWRLDRLGRLTTELCHLFDELRERKVDLICLRDGFTLSTPSGRHFARTLASAAEYDNEVRTERIREGQAVARSEGKTWGGSKPGTRRKVTAAQRKVIKRMHQDSDPIAEIARTVKLSRPTVYAVLRELGLHKKEGAIV